MEYLDRSSCLSTDGLFRKAGSSARQKKLREEIEAAETFDCTSLEGLDISLSSLDCASVLKQWLRELPEPLIPVRLHDVFLKCCSLSSSEDKMGALLLATLLLPPLHSASLLCLTRFLSKVASNAPSNKMDSKSLAIVFTPGLFHASGDEMAKGGVSNSGNEVGTFNIKMNLVETLINNSSKVSMVEESIDEALSSLSANTGACNFLSRSEDNLDTVGTRNETEFAGPSARRRKKKKRRSGSLSRVLTEGKEFFKGFSKVISRSTTPAGTRCNSTTNIANNIDGESEKVFSATNLLAPDFLQTPSSFCTPKIRVNGIDTDLETTCGKRKARQIDSISTASKNKEPVLNATPLNLPINRGRSITLKGKFNRKKSICGGIDTDNLDSAKNKDKNSTCNRGLREPMNYSNCTTTPLPSKQTFASLIRQNPKPSFQVSNTPGTPNSFGLPSAAQDLSGFGSPAECTTEENDSISFELFQRNETTCKNTSRVTAAVSLTSVVNKMESDFEQQYQNDVQTKLVENEQVH